MPPRPRRYATPELRREPRPRGRCLLCGDEDTHLTPEAAQAGWQRHYRLTHLKPPPAGLNPRQR